MKSASEIIGENLSLLESDSTKISERRLVQLRELAAFVARNNFFLDSEIPAEDFGELFRPCDISEDTPDEAKNYLASAEDALFLCDKLYVCKYIAEESEKRKKSLLPRLLSTEPYSNEVKIAYFKNAYADAAFRSFSQIFENPSVIYAPDFSAACEEVYYGRADMCMLPLDSSRDAKLISFYRLIDKYELNPIFSCDITTPDGSVTTRYALLKKSIGLPKAEHREKCDFCFFEFTVIPDRDGTLGDVLTAAKEFGLSVYKLDSIPLTYSDSEFSYDVILKVGDMKSLEAFVLFMTFVFPQYEPLGVYNHVLSEN